ncbi:lanthionine synthetase LanC family protein [Fodinibius roseus]|nr:lanthionine synthetase LanC family protein [Fodinibius roseus]
MDIELIKDTGDPIKRDMVIEKTKVINDILMQAAPAMNNMGLLNGKLGISIYFFHFAKVTGSKKHHQLAQRLFDEVYEGLSRNGIPVNFEDGLAGIALGIEYLAQNGFVNTDTDDIFSKTDNRIYRHIVANDQLPIGILEGAMGSLLYVLSRLSKQDIQTEDPSTFVFRRLLIRLVNHIGERVEERKYSVQEPLMFDVSWDLPLCLILLGKVREMDIYSYKINHIIDHLSPVVLSLYPRLSSNRLYLLLGIESILQQIDLPEWQNHATLLKQNIAMDEILEEELRDKSLHLMHGAAGVDLVSRQLHQLIQVDRLLFNREQLIEKIIYSEYWEKIEQNEIESRSLGLLFYGLTGVGLHLLTLLEGFEKPSLPF